MNILLLLITFVSHICCAQNDTYFSLWNTNLPQSNGVYIPKAQRAVDFVMKGELLKPVKKIWLDEKIMDRSLSKLMIGTHSYASALCMSWCAYNLLLNMGLVFVYSAGCAVDLSKYCLNRVGMCQQQTATIAKGKNAFHSSLATLGWTLGLGASVALGIAPYAIIDTYRK